MSREKRLIGGSNAKRAEFPWIVSLQRKPQNNSKDSLSPLHFCGSGAILDSTKVLTVSHCVWDKNETSLQILAGVLTTSLETRESGYQLVSVRKALMHPNYTT